MNAKRSFLTALAVSVAASACATLIGVEDAEVDPNLNLDGSGGSAASAAGGSSGDATGGNGGSPQGGSGNQPGGGQGGGGAGTGGQAAGGGGAGGGSGGAGATAGQGTGGNAGQGAAGADAGPATLCERYCTTVMANCTGVNRVYSTLAICEAVCALLPAGQQGDVRVNSVECRLAQASLAGSTGEPSAHCPAAGPGGNDVCGADCEGLCMLAENLCSVFTAGADAGDPGGCRNECERLDNLDTYDTSMQSGAGVECRLYHVSAATQDRTVHCPHVGGAAPCADPPPPASDGG